MVISRLQEGNVLLAGVAPGGAAPALQGLLNLNLFESNESFQTLVVPKVTDSTNGVTTTPPFTPP